MLHSVKQKINNKETREYLLIDTPKELKRIEASLSSSPHLAVDLEADSMYHYTEKVCLVQLATAEVEAVIDALKIKDLSPLKPIFADPAIQKIFHGADYDVRSLYRDFQMSINNLFDTQLACRFLGVRETGLESVLSARFGIQLNKKFQKKDWSKRPLPDEMIEYAITDVRYLIVLAEELQRELKQKGRLSWVMEECSHLSRVRPSSDNDMPLYLRFKGAGRLDSRSLAVLEELLRWREKVAERRDRSPFKIIGNKTLMSIAVKKTADLDHLQKTGVLTQRQILMYGDAIKKAVCRALALPENLLPQYPHRPFKPKEPELRKRLYALKAWRDKKAKTLKLEPALVCSKTLMINIAQKNPQHLSQLNEIEGLKNWQRIAFGSEILRVLNR
ncbi:MAG: ribonuclease D [Deltaproteobacteria bacterium]|nr:ribonuclease D [Deltaproteobacteria bacterium]MBW1960733.1 ribonuclease D [Deltaproteobacteria bacterium]MBW2152605.1 ribonuclease D [Deltaproteobacteria bacterium]